MIRLDVERDSAISFHDFNPNTPIAAVMSMTKPSGIGPDHVLFFKEHQLVNYQSLAYYNIDDNARLGM